MSIEIEIVKGKSASIELSELATGRKFKFAFGHERRVCIKMDANWGIPDVLYRWDGCESAHRANNGTLVYPCDSDGNIEPSGVEKVRADGIRDGNLYMDEGKLFAVYGTHVGSGNIQVVCIAGCSSAPFSGHEKATALVTPGTIKSIVFHEGASDATGGG